MRRPPRIPPRLTALLLLLVAAATARAADPAVDNLLFLQRTDGSGFVDITYDVADADDDSVFVMLEVSGNGGLTWELPCHTLSGDYGVGVPTGVGRHIIWSAKDDIPGFNALDVRLRLLVSDEPFPRDMVRIPAGEFELGGEGGPAIGISRDYLIDRHEVTNAEFRELAQWAYDTGRMLIQDGTARDAESRAPLFSLDHPALELYFETGAAEFHLRRSPEASTAYPESYLPAEHPVKALTWHGAAVFCNWLSLRAGLPPAYDTADWSCHGGAPASGPGYRLPTEAEWEYAVRCPDGRSLPWGGDDPDCARANFAPGGAACVGWSTPVGAYHHGTSNRGAADLAGNLDEWCNDWEGDLPTEPTTDPAGPAAGDRRIIRGGDWLSAAGGLSAAARAGAAPGAAYATLGLRVARTCDNSFPSAPSSPAPADDAVVFTEEVQLTWSAHDPDDDPLSFDLYLDGALHAADLTETAATIAVPDHDFTWRILARDSGGFEQWSPEWRLRPRETPTGRGLAFTFDQPFFVGAAGEMLADHSVVLDAGLYHCFHIYHHAGGGPEQLGHLTSADLCAWTREPDILPVAEGEPWEAWGIWAPQVMPNPDPEGPRWVMFYTGVESSHTGQQIGLAYSEDLHEWWRADAAHEAANPLYHPTADWAEWEPAQSWDAHCRDPFAFEEEGVWYLLTTCADAEGRGVLGIAAAPGDSLFGFMGNDLAQPLATVDAEVLPESPQLHRIDRVGDDPLWHLIFSGASGTRHQSATTMFGGAEGWSTDADPGARLGSAPYTAAECTLLDGAWILSQHRYFSELDTYILAFNELDFTELDEGHPTFVDLSPLERLRGLGADGRPDSTLRWEIVGPVSGHAFEYQPTWGDNPAARGDDPCGLGGNAYLATWERHWRPDLSGAGVGAGEHYPDYARTGWIRSTAFELLRNRIRLLVGGGDHPDAEFVALVRAADDVVLFSATGNDSHTLTERVWNTGSLRGETVYFVVADLTDAAWGCIAVDEIEVLEESGDEGDAPDLSGPSLWRIIDR